MVVTCITLHKASSDCAQIAFARHTWRAGKVSCELMVGPNSHAGFDSHRVAVARLTLHASEVSM